VSSKDPFGSPVHHDDANKIYHNDVYGCGPGSSVGIATELRDGRSGDRITVGRDFPLSRLVLGPKQPPVQWVPVFLGGKLRLGRAVGHSPLSNTAIIEG
jgi:hypothetical protein